MGDPDRRTLFALADHLRLLPSELAARLTRQEFVELVAFHNIRSRDHDG